MQGTAAFTPTKPDGREVNVNRSNIPTSIHNDWESQHVYVNCFQIYIYYIVLFNFFDTFTKIRYVSFGFIWNLDVQFCINKSQMGNKMHVIFMWLYTIQVWQQWRKSLKVTVDLRGVFWGKQYSAPCINGKYINLYIIGELI